MYLKLSVLVLQLLSMFVFFFSLIAFLFVVDVGSLLLFSLPSLLFPQVVGLFHVSNKNTLLLIFHAYLFFSLRWFWAYILSIVASLIYFRFRNYMYFDTDRLCNFFHHLSSFLIVIYMNCVLNWSKIFL